MGRRAVGMGACRRMHCLLQLQAVGTVDPAAQPCQRQLMPLSCRITTPQEERKRRAERKKARASATSSSYYPPAETESEEDEDDF